MILRKNIYSGTLAFAITLAVGVQTFAMPTGGEIVVGNITNVDNPAKTMVALDNSMINWQDFSIAVGESVNFDTKNFVVLNKVIGGQESQILGMLSDQGNGKLILVNPAGIVIGSEAVINANDLMLSTLNFNQEDFTKLVNGELVTFEQSDGAKTSIKIGNNTKFTLKEALELYGGKIDIADGVQIVSDHVEMITGDGIGVKGAKVKSSNDRIYSFGNDDNTINIGKAHVVGERVNIRGYKTNINGTEIDANREAVIMGGKELNINNADVDVRPAVLNADGWRCGDIIIHGHKLSINDSNIRANGDIMLLGGINWHIAMSYGDTPMAYYVETEPSSEVNIANTKIVSNGDINLLGGSVNLKKSNLQAFSDILVGAIKSYQNEHGQLERTSYTTSSVNIDTETTINAGNISTAYGANVNGAKGKFDNIIIEQNPVVPAMGSNSTLDDVLVEMLKSGTDVNEIKSYLREQSTDLKSSSILMTTIAESNLAFADKAELIDEVLVAMGEKK